MRLPETMASDPTVSATMRRCQRVIRMVSELHRLGYQRLRVMPYEYPVAWRLAIGPTELFSSPNGAYIPRPDEDLLATYSSASENAYFGWDDAHGATSRQLAEKFIVRFPAICELGLGRDWAYAGWLGELVGVLERTGRLPVVMWDYGPPPLSLRSLPLRHFGHALPDEDFPLPPISQAAPSDEGASKFDIGEYGAGGDDFDLTRFASISKLVGVAMAVGIRMFRERDEDAGHHMLVPAARALAGRHPAYVVDPDWCRIDALGAALIVALDLPANLVSGDDLEAHALFGLEHVSLAVRDILISTERRADWERVTWPMLMELHAFAASAFLGSASTLYPGKSLGHFIRPQPK